MFNTTRIQENEVARADDLEFAFQSVFGNFEKFSEALTNVNTNFVIGGALKKGTGWKFTVTPLIGICANNQQLAVNSKPKELSIQKSDTTQRIDTVYIKASLNNTENALRAFKEDSVISTKEISTRHLLNVEYIVRRGDAGAVKAKSIAEEGNLENVIKIGEILIPANASSITECYLFPVTKDISSETNENWTNNVNDTTKLYSLMEFQEIFRAIHNRDGSLKNAVVSKNNLDLGSGASQINLNSFILGASMYEKGADSNLATVISSISTDITSKSDSGHTHDSLKNGNHTLTAPEGKSGTIALTSDISDVLRHSSQSLSDEQKSQARSNIGAGTSSLVIGTTTGTACDGADSRLSDARTPTAHTHNTLEDGEIKLTMPDTSGTIALTSDISDVLRYSSQKLTSEQKSQARSNIGAGTSSLVIGDTAGTACEGNDSRLSDARTPLAHNNTSKEVILTDYTGPIRNRCNFENGENFNKTLYELHHCITKSLRTLYMNSSNVEDGWVYVPCSYIIETSEEKACYEPVLLFYIGDEKIEGFKINNDYITNNVLLYYYEKKSSVIINSRNSLSIAIDQTGHATQNIAMLLVCAVRESYVE